MVIHNLSKRPTKTLKKLVRFAEKHSHTSDLISLYVNPVENEMVAGLARKFDFHSFWNDGAPSSIVLTVATDYKYPQSSCYRKSVGLVTFLNWEEEFLYVLAHEMRHVDQFWVLGLPKQYEVDAEKHAVRLLQTWRGDSV